MFEEAKNIRIVTEPGLQHMYVTIQTNVSVTKGIKEKVYKAKEELKSVLPIVHDLNLTNNVLRLVILVPMKFNDLCNINNIAGAGIVLLDTIKNHLETWDKVKSIAADLKPYYDESNK